MQRLLLGVRIYFHRYFSTLFHSMHMTAQVMWFQGRDDGIDKEVVSLSTGRIYKATSEDGLEWTLESGPGACESSLDVNEEEWWSFDTAHLGLGGECYRGLSEDCLWYTEFVDFFLSNNEPQLTSCLFFGRYAPTHVSTIEHKRRAVKLQRQSADDRRSVYHVLLRGGL